MPLDQLKSKVIVKTSSGLVQINPETTMEAVDGLSTELASAVHKTGAESVDGIKTFEKNTMAEAVALSGSEINVTLSAFFTKTISADTTFTFTGAPSGKTCAFTLILTNGGAANVTWPNNINWMGGQAPTLKETGIDVLTFFTVNGGTVWMEVSGSISGGSSGSGTIADSGVIAGTYGPSANVSGTYSGTFVIPEISVNQKGQVTQVIDRVVTLPASDNTDISVQVVENGWTKSYLLGVDAANQVSGVPMNVTAIADKDVYITGSPGVLHATTFEGSLSGNATSATKATNDVDNNPIKTTYAKLASPALTGTPTAPTAATGTNTTQIATTAFVQDALSGYTPSGGSGAKEIQYSTVEPTTSTVSTLDNESLIFYEESSMSGSFNGSYVVPANYIGATSSASGVAGLVPPATSAERDYYLKGDGTWAAASGGGSVSDYVGATSSASGTHGLVPAATSAERDSYLKGDGTWGSISLPSTYVGATGSASGTAGLVPAATSSDTAKFLQGDGTWAAGVHIAGSETISGAKTFAQGPYGTTSAVSASEINLADGTVFTKTISANTTFTITGAPSGTACSFSLLLTNGGAYTVAWPASIKWAGGNVPTLTESGVDLLTFLTPDGGTTWYGVLSVGGAA